MYLIASPFNYNGCENQANHWKWGESYSCGDELRINMLNPEDRLECVMEYTKNGEAFEKACYLNIKAPGVK